METFPIGYSYILLHLFKIVNAPSVIFWLFYILNKNAAIFFTHTPMMKKKECNSEGDGAIIIM